jgi:hypothetical protein
VKHRQQCRQFAPVEVVMPKGGSWLEFKKFAACIRHPLVVYADFESQLESVREVDSEVKTLQQLLLEMARGGSGSTVLQVHKPAAWEALVVCDVPFPGCRCALSRGCDKVLQTVLEC